MVVVTTTLADLVAARGALRPGELVTLGAGLAEDLRAVHEAGLAHGHVEAQRVVLVAGGRPVLVPASASEARPADDVRALAALLAWAGGLTGSGDPADLPAGGAQLEAAPRAVDRPGSDPATRRVAAVLARAAQPPQTAPTADGRGGPEVPGGAQGGLVTLSGLMDALAEAAPAMALRLPLVPSRVAARPDHARPAPARRRGGASHRQRHAVRSRRARPLLAALGLGAGLVVALTLTGTLAGRADPPGSGPRTVGQPQARGAGAGAPADVAPRGAGAAPRPSAPAPTVAAQTPATTRRVPPADALAGLRLLDTARAHAYATGDAAALAALYLPGSPALVRDLANLAQLRDQGLVARGFRTVVDTVRVTGAGPGWVRLRVVDHIPPFSVSPARPGSDAPPVTQSGRGARAFQIVLVRTGESTATAGWLYASVSPAGGSAGAPATRSAAAAPIPG